MYEHIPKGQTLTIRLYIWSCFLLSRSFGPLSSVLFSLIGSSSPEFQTGSFPGLDLWPCSCKAVPLPLSYSPASAVSGGLFLYFDLLHSVTLCWVNSFLFFFPMSSLVIFLYSAQPASAYSHPTAAASYAVQQVPGVDHAVAPAYAPAVQAARSVVSAAYGGYQTHSTQEYSYGTRQPEPAPQPAAAQSYQVANRHSPIIGWLIYSKYFKFWCINTFTTGRK